MNHVGSYYRKSGVYDPSNGWCRKWTYKVGYIVSGKEMRLIAMTDGMISLKKNWYEVEDWVSSEGMVKMSKSEIISFFENESGNNLNKL